MTELAKRRRHDRKHREKDSRSKKEHADRKTNYLPIVIIVTVAVAAILVVVLVLYPQWENNTDEKVPVTTKQPAGNDAENSEIIWYEYGAGMQLSKSENKPIMIDFYGYDKSTNKYCPPCKDLDEKTFTNSMVIKNSKEFVCIKVNCWDEKNNNLCSSYNLEGVPTIVFLDANEREIHRFVGYKDPDAFITEMNNALRNA